MKQFFNLFLQFGKECDKIKIANWKQFKNNAKTATKNNDNGWALVRKCFGGFRYKGTEETIGISSKNRLDCKQIYCLSLNIAYDKIIFV